MALKHNVQLVLSQVGGQGFSGAEAWTVKGELCNKKGLLQL